VFLVLRFRLLGHVILRRRQCNMRSSDRRQLKEPRYFGSRISWYYARTYRISRYFEKRGSAHVYFQ